MKKVKVLFIDDDITLGKVVTLALNESGYETYYQTSLTAIHSVISEIQPDIIILDVEFGDKNGIDITPELRFITPKIPILFVSSHISSFDISRALEAGGIAYLKKPFEIDELLAYIKRHTHIFSVKSIPVGKLSFYPEENFLVKGNNWLKKLTILECKLLMHLIINKNKVIARKELEVKLWGHENGNEHSLNNYISKLRKLLSTEKEIDIVTIPKVGYKFEDRLKQEAT